MVEGENTLFVGNIRNEISCSELERLLYELFSQCGTVTAVRCPGDSEDNSRGFAFVELASPAQVLYASLAISGLVLKGRYLRLAYGRTNEDELAARLSGVPRNFDEVDIYENLCRHATGFRAISVKRQQDGFADGRCTIWMSSTEEREELVRRWPALAKTFTDAV